MCLRQVFQRQGTKAIAAHAKIWEESKSMSKFLALEGKRSELWLLGYTRTPQPERAGGAWGSMLLEFWGSFGLK